MNTLYYGDNLDILRSYIQDESVHLVYLDPPFKSDQNYNVLFQEKDGSQSASQIKAFEDTWQWDEAAALSYEETVEAGGQVAQALIAFRRILGTNDMLAYLSMMAPRLVELRRVLKPSGSLYLHCDPTASHYLKLLLDSIFGSKNFRNEIVWRRSHPKGHASTRLASTHDVILAFAKDVGSMYWSPIYLSHDPEKAVLQYALTDENGRRYQLTSLLNPNPNRPNLTYEFKGVTKVWRWTKERMMAEDEKGRIVVPKYGKGIPRYKRYLDEQRGIPLGDWWGDIEIATGGERLGYQTQKPEALLERIIQASSNEGDVVLDPFCGCGTTIAAAQHLGRRWIGIDVTQLAINLIRHRLRDSFDEDHRLEVIGEPTSLHDAQALAKQDPYQFQWWALGLAGARPAEQKKGADRGIDGRLYFHDEGRTGKTKQIIFSVKAGRVTASHIRDLAGVLDREKAQIGVFLSLQPPTEAMRKEAASAGFYKSPWGKHPRLQLHTIESLLDRQGIDYPQPADVTFKKARRVKNIKEQLEQLELLEQPNTGLKDL